MRVTIAPASTRTGTAVIRSLLAATAPIEIDAIYRNLAKVPEEFANQPHFHARQGDVSDPSTLDFSGADAVLAITPPAFDGRDIVAHAESVSNNVKGAIEKAGGVKRLVLLSSGGAQFSTGVGEIKTNNMAERVFATAQVPAITFVRCAYFMENWTTNLDTLKTAEPFFFSPITPLDWKIPMVAVDDIGSTLAVELLKETTFSPSKPYVFELHGPRNYSPRHVQEAFSKALGRSVAIRAIEKEELHGFFSQVFPEQIVGDWVEMATSLLPGGILAADTMHYHDHVLIVRASSELEPTLQAAIDRKLLCSATR